jgi:tRNA 2-thiouridine synthesizing protein C
MKSFLIITRQAPYGTSYGKEALDAVLMASAFVRVSLLFLDDGVFQIKRLQDSELLAIKDYSPTFGVLEQYEVKDIYVSESSLRQRGLTDADLVVDAEIISDARVSELLDVNDVVLSF